MAITRLDTAAATATLTTLDYTVSAGTDRLLIIAWAAEDTSIRNITLDYGGQTPIEAIDEGTDFGVAIWGGIHFLTDSMIDAATDDTLTITWSGSTDASVFTLASYEGFDQTWDPITEAATNWDTTGSSTPNPLTGADLTESPDGLVVASAGNGSGSQSATWASDMTEQSDLTSGSAMTCSMADRLSTTSANVDIEPTWTSQNRTGLFTAFFAGTAGAAGGGIVKPALSTTQRHLLTR